MFENTSKPSNSFDPFLVRIALLAQAKATLSKLTILASHFNHEGCFMGSPREFEVLREAHIEWRSLITRTLITYYHILPDSLRFLHLCETTGCRAQAYEQLLQGIIIEKTGASLNLEILR